jgi:hypothetical protein
MNPQADKAIIIKAAWKKESLAMYLTSFLKAGLRATGPFNNDDVPDAEQPLDKTTVGAGVRMLLACNIISHAGTTRPSTRKECNGHRNNLYIVQPGLAREWLRRHGVETETRQLDLAL